MMSSCVMHTTPINSDIIAYTTHIKQTKGRNSIAMATTCSIFFIHYKTTTVYQPLILTKPSLYKLGL